MKRNLPVIAFYRSHRSELVDYASRVGADAASAEDVVQDAWIQLDRHPEPQSLREPIAYLKRIVRNLVIDRARRRRHENLLDDALEMAARTVADSAPGPEQHLAAVQEAEIVLAAIEAMPPRQQIAMKMYHFEGRKLREIADRLGISKSLVHILVKQGLELCDKCREDQQ